MMSNTNPSGNCLRAQVAIIIGASKMSHLEDNLGAVEVELSADELAALDAAYPSARVYPHWFTDLTHDQAHGEALGG